VSLLQPVLRRFRNRQMVRIAWRDLTRRADLSETMTDLSRLAEACFAATVPLLDDALAREVGAPQNRFGQRQELVVIAMGKLGAGELNFSSDVDLIFAFPDSGRTPGSQGRSGVSNETYFSRLCQALIKLMGATTADGFVFRMDTRLRPFGDSGPLVMSFDSLEDYYQSQGREWERYAWIKARAIIRGGGQPLTERLKPFVFRRFLDYGAFDSLREMKHRITTEVRRKGVHDNIKLGPGGIREIEFFGQVFQLIRGGVDPRLQARSIVKVLDALAHQGTISRRVNRQLQEAYAFLRTTEHRLQVYADQQLHNLPDDAVGRLRLAVSMGYSDWTEYLGELDRHRSAVHRHFQQLLETGDEEDRSAQAPDAAWADLWHGSGPVDAGLPLPEATLVAMQSRLAQLRGDPVTQSLSAEGRRRLDRLMPRVLAEVSQAAQPALVLSRIIDLLRTIQQRINYLALMLENPSVLTHLVRLADASPWVCSFLARHPVLLDELLDPRTLFSPPEGKALDSEIRQKIARLAPDDLELHIQELCIFKQINTLRVAAADVAGNLPLMRTSDHLTDIAETVVRQVLDLSWDHLAQKHGHPLCAVKGQKCDRGFAVIAYGKLGGIELGYGSDLDLVFVHAGEPGVTDGARKPLDNAQFFARLGQRVLHLLTTHTAAGRLYDADMRLRPSGSSGLLVSHLDGFRSYQMESAWTWEHQALVRARVIAGDPVVAHLFETIRHAVLTLRRDPDRLRKEVMEMRLKMRRAKTQKTLDRFHIKQSPGGIVDIEFLVQYLVLRNACDHPQLTRWTDNVRLLETLSDSGVIDIGQANLLKSAYLTYRSEVHRLSLQEKPAEVAGDRFGSYPQKVSSIWAALINGRKG
jgi:glutamate-ammonia-ligase adenylyltransferase